MIEKLKKRYEKSFLSNERFILGLEFVLITASLAMIYYMWSGSRQLELLFYPVAAIMMVPFFSTYAHYKGFEKTAKASLVAILAIPILGLSILFSMEFGPQAPGIIAVLILFGVALTAAVLPYLMFTGALILHFYREYIKKK